jgi:hypothetical protein
VLPPKLGRGRGSGAHPARRFVMEGMLGLVDQRPGHAGRKGHVYPEAVAAYMLYVKQLYPPIHDREVVRILQRKFGYTTNQGSGNNGTRNGCKRSMLGRKYLTFCEQRPPMVGWAYVRSQKSSAKAKTSATSFAKVCQQPIELYAVVPSLGFLFRRSLTPLTGCLTSFRRIGRGPKTLSAASRYATLTGRGGACRLHVCRLVTHPRHALGGTEAMWPDGAS